MDFSRIFIGAERSSLYMSKHVYICTRVCTCMSISLEQQQFKELRTSLLMIPARQSRQSLGLAGGQEALSAVCEQSQARHIRVPGIFEQI